MNDHPLSTGRMMSLLRQTPPETLPDGIDNLQGSMHVSNTFEIRLTDYLGARIHVEANGLTMANAERPDIAPRPKIRSAGVYPNLVVRECADGVRRDGQGEDLYSHEGVNLYLPEWSEHVGDGPVDDADLTRALAYGLEPADRIFPGGIREEDGDVGDQLRRLNERSAAAADWLLGRIDGDRAQVDLDRMRVQAGQDIFDGHGTLLACGMPLRPEETRQLVEGRGEDAFRAALARGDLHFNSSAAHEDKRLDERRIDRICDRLLGRSDQTVNLWLKASWDPETFENAIRPRLRADPFARSFRSFDGKCMGRVMVEARMDRPDTGAEVEP